MENCSGTPGSIAGKPWTFTTTKSLGNLYKFGSLLVKMSSEIYEPLNRWSNTTVCTERKGTTTYRYGVLNSDGTWSLLNKVDNHFFVFAYILNKFEELGISVVVDNSVDVGLLDNILSSGKYEFEDGTTIDTPKKEDFLSEDGEYYDDVICMIYGTTKAGDEAEIEAMEYLKSISRLGGEWEGMCPGDITDVNKGIDIIQIIDGKAQGFQVKPFTSIGGSGNDVIVGGVGNAKPYSKAPNGPDFYVFVGKGQKTGDILVFKNEGVRVVKEKNKWGRFVKVYSFPSSSSVIQRIREENTNQEILKPLNEWYVFKNTMLI